MKNEKSVALCTFVILLFCIGAMFLLSSCSKQPEKVETKPTLAATPAEVKMEGQSANWKVTVQSVNKIERQPVDPMAPVQSQDPENKYDTLQLTVDIAYTGQASEVPSPTVMLNSGREQKSPALKAAIDTPGAIYMMSYGPGYSSLKTLYTGELSSTHDPAEAAKTEKPMKELLQWVDPQNRASNKKRRALKAGEKNFPDLLFSRPNGIYGPETDV